MPSWEELRAELIQKVIHGEKSGLIQKEISHGLIHGTYYYKPGPKGELPIRGVLLIPGISASQFGLEVLAQRLAMYGYFCLVLELPSHGQNPNDFSMGLVCESINEGVHLLRSYFKITRIAVIGHSMGAVAAIFTNYGYTREIEQKMYLYWHQMLELLTQEAKLIDTGKNQELLAIHIELEKIYASMKQLILYSIKKGIKELEAVKCYVLLSAPRDCKASFPVGSLFRQLNQKTAKKIFEFLFHKSAIYQLKKEGLPRSMIRDDDPHSIYWQQLRIKDHREFIRYFLTMKEPVDFLTLIDQLISLRKKDNLVTFFEYFQKKYILQKPKLFIYGWFDILLRPFMPFQRKRLESFYSACGNAQIIHGYFSHIMMDNPTQQLAIIAIKNKKVTESIIRFMDQHIFKV